MMKFEEIVKKTKELDSMFKQRFDTRDRALDLVEEVGELAQAMQIFEKRKLTNDPSKRRSKKDLADALADILYDVILLAGQYEINLEKEYIEMLERLKERVGRGEFDGNE